MSDQRRKNLIPIHLHFLHYCDVASDSLDRALVLVAVFRWRSIVGEYATGHGRRGVLCPRGRLCDRSGHHLVVAATAPATG